MTSLLDYLRNHAIDPRLCHPSHPAVKASRRAVANATPRFVNSMFNMLATDDVLQIARSTLFGSGLRRAWWRDLLADAPNLAALPPDMLCDPDLVSPPAPESLDTPEKLTNYCVGLVSRRAAKAGDDGPNDAPASVVAPLGTTLSVHAWDLFKLRTSHPEVFAGVIADDGTAILIAQRIANQLERHSVVRTIQRQWLLNRAFHLQRGFAYVAAAGRAATPAPLRSVVRGKYDVSATAAAAYVDTLGQGAERSLAGYEHWLFTGGSASTPGCTSRPIDFATGVTRPPWNRLRWTSKILIRRTLNRNYALIRSKISTLLAVKSAGLADGRRTKANLYRAAGLTPPDERQLLLFEIWHHGLSPTALLLVLAIRYAQAAAVARIILEAPDRAFNGTSSAFKFRLTRANTQRIAHEMGAQIIGEGWPSLDNIDKNFKLARVHVGRHGAGSAVHQGWADERMKFEALDPLHNALPRHLRNLSSP